MRTLILCAVPTGMRRGELLGLQWEDIDLEGHRLFVRRPLWRAKFVTPKSRRSRRTIDLAPTLRSALARLPSRFQGGLVFCRAGAKSIEPDNFMLDRLVFGENGRDGAGRVIAEAVQRLQNGSRDDEGVSEKSR